MINQIKYNFHGKKFPYIYSEKTSLYPTGNTTKPKLENLQFTFCRTVSRLLLKRSFHLNLTIPMCVQFKPFS